MKKFNTVRAGYLYIVCGSLLLGGGVLLIMQSAAALLYSRYAADSGALIVKLLHWMINHVGRLPMAVILFISVFAFFFLLRSQKISDDIKAILQASEGLALHGSFRELEVGSGGELRRLADNLRRVNRRGHKAEQREYGPPEPAGSPRALPDSEELMTLILRMKLLLRLLDELENGQETLRDIEAVKREAAGLEQFLERLIAGS
jgi:hypothetical protein